MIQGFDVHVQDRFLRSQNALKPQLSETHLQYRNAIYPRNIHTGATADRRMNYHLIQTTSLPHAVLARDYILPYIRITAI